ncbi:hypothetical protein [Sphingomonas azotifigens]|uniref:hypothetical protein n=1 Tax=Sphingomonas azotifigens TaxID=330920 RepID=UPI00111C862A|nr:hypothetical protein [Sphingomonas azotifigens]
MAVIGEVLLAKPLQLAESEAWRLVDCTGFLAAFAADAAATTDVRNRQKIALHANPLHPAAAKTRLRLRKDFAR